MKLSDIKQLIKNNEDIIKQKDLYINSEPYLFNEKRFFDDIEELDERADMVYSICFCTNDWELAASNNFNKKDLELFVKNRRFAQVKVFAQAIKKDNKFIQPTEKAMEQFNNNN